MGTNQVDMKENLTFITASAGTGKTYRLVQELREAVMEGQARPEAVIATTFTVAAAAELKERLALSFHREGLHDEADRLESDAMISTVHGICFNLLSRFAFDAGISPDLRILDENETKLLLDQAIDQVVDESVRQRIYAVASRLGQRNPFTWAWNWRGDVKAIVEAARSNDISLDQLPAMGASSWRDLAAEMGPPTEDDLDARLIDRIDRFLGESMRSEKQNTRKYRSTLKSFRSRVEDVSFPWSNWARLLRERPEKDLKPFAEEIDLVASRVGEHPRLHQDLEEYLGLLFDLAQRAGERFNEMKRNRGVADFVDLEKSALDLLREQPSVASVLAEEVDLLIVDEFQDTSPIQLALFVELGKLAKRIIWVGDVKQSIYGFRGSDPELVFQAADGAAHRESLTRSWRSLPDLVSLCNQCFASVFEERLGLPKEETVIDAHRRPPAGSSPSVESVEISSGIELKNGNTKELAFDQKQEVIADAVADLLSRQGEQVVTKASVSGDDPVGETRDLTPDDIAVLTRTGKEAGAIAENLRSRGFDVSVSGPGLLSTPEAILAVACLRRWIDPTDSLAAAEIVALEGRHDPEVWIADRIRYLRELEGSESMDPWVLQSSPALSSLHRAAESDRGLAHHSPLATFDRATAAAGINRIVSLWGPGQTRVGQRLANLEKLRSYVGDFERRSEDNGLPATCHGLLGWLSDLAVFGQDEFPGVSAGGSIFVGTYHASKGLEWPMVFLSSLDHAARTNLFNLRVVGTTTDLDFSDPLRGRELRRWINPFGGSSGSGGESHPLIVRLNESATGEREMETGRNESLRLLYVGMTRARDRLLFLHEPRTPSAWLEETGKDNAKAILYPHGVDGPLVTSRVRKYEWGGEESGGGPQSVLTQLELPVAAESRTPRQAARLIPSQAEPVEGASVVAVQSYGERLVLRGGPDERDLGDAMHRLLAAEVLMPDSPSQVKLDRVSRMLDSFALADCVVPGEVVRVSERYRELVREQFAIVDEAVEVPFTVVDPEGRSVTGFIDHLLRLEDGSHVIIDHKIFPGGETDWEAKALGYSGQLAVYARALGESEVRTYLHFAVVGALIEISV